MLTEILIQSSISSKIDQPFASYVELWINKVSESI